MSRVVELLCSRRAPQMAVLAFVSVGFSACSADMQTRFQQAPFGPVESTGSVQQRPQPQRYAEPRELPQYSRPQYQPAQPQYQSQALPPISAPASYPVAGGGSGMSGGGRGVASYEPPARYEPPPARAPIESTGSVAPRSVAAARPAAAPAPAAGTTIIVGTSDTLEGL